MIQNGSHLLNNPPRWFRTKVHSQVQRNSLMDNHVDKDVLLLQFGSAVIYNKSYRLIDCSGQSLRQYRFHNRESHLYFLSALLNEINKND